ncbi:unnamed protein product [Linum trigynum]
MAATANGNDFEENGTGHDELLDLSEEGLCLAESLSNEADVDEDEYRQRTYSESDKEAKPFSLLRVMGVERNILIHPVSAPERNTANGDLVVDTISITASSEGTLLQVKAGLGESSCIPSTVSLPTAGQTEHHCDLENGLELDTREGTIVTEFAGLDKIVIDDAEYNKRKMVKIKVNHELQLQLDFPVHVDLNTDSVQPSLKQCQLRELVYEQSVKPTQSVRTSFPTSAMVIVSEIIGIIEPQAVDVVEDSALSGVPPRVVKIRLCFQQHQLVHSDVYDLGSMMNTQDVDGIKFVIGASFPNRSDFVFRNHNGILVIGEGDCVVPKVQWYWWPRVKLERRVVCFNFMEPYKDDLAREVGGRKIPTVGVG